MIDILRARFHQGYRTIRFPKGADPERPERFVGRPEISQEGCTGCGSCVQVCPTDALHLREKTPSIDMGLCTFCAVCAETCPQGVIRFGSEFRLAAQGRQALLVPSQGGDADPLREESIHNLFGRSLKLRQVSAGGCGSCEADTNVLNTVGWDLGRLGVQFVASPRHADGLLVTGPVTKNMERALRKTYDATPSPKIVIAVGTCAVSGGLFRTHTETLMGVDTVLPVDLYIPGCPPHPATILEGLARLLGRIPAKQR